MGQVCVIIIFCVLHKLDIFKPPHHPQSITGSVGLCVSYNLSMWKPKRGGRKGHLPSKIIELRNLPTQKDYFTWFFFIHAIKILPCLCYGVRALCRDSPYLLWKNTEHL